MVQGSQISIRMIRVAKRTGGGWSMKSDPAGPMSTPIQMSAERTGGGKTGDKSVSPGGAWLVPAARAGPSPWEVSAAYSFQAICWHTFRCGVGAQPGRRGRSIFVLARVWYVGSALGPCSYSSSPVRVHVSSHALAAGFCELRHHGLHRVNDGPLFAGQGCVPCRRSQLSSLRAPFPALRH